MMDNTSPFLDKFSEITIKHGRNLPHWHQDGKIQYVTFRLADSLPKSQIKEIKETISQFEMLHPKPWTLKIIKQFRNKIGLIEENLLHNGHGDCVLKQPKLRKILSDAILFKVNEDYYVYAFVIMPNHVHLLIQPFPGKELKDILHSIKRFSSYQINKQLNRQGRLWFRESYDHIVRDYDEFKHCYNYIIRNPKRLPKSYFTLYFI